MLSKRFNKLIPTICYIVLAIVVSMILLNYFGINLSNNNYGVLTRYAVVEGMHCNKRKGRENNPS